MIPGQVNIVIPLYNQEAYIRQCVESALNQTYKNFTVTVVNDGSTDASRRVLQETIDNWMAPDALKRAECEKEIAVRGLYYELRRKQIWDKYFPNSHRLMTEDGAGWTDEEGILRAEYVREVNEQDINDDKKWELWKQYFPDGERVAPLVIDQVNAGLSESRNRAIRAGDGEFILPLDADDWIDKDFLELAVPLMADSKVGIVAPVMQYEGLLHNTIPPRGLSLAHEMNSNDLPVCSLYRRECFNQTKRGYETIFVEISGSTRVLGYEDYCFWLDVLKRGWNVAVLDKPVFHYRVRAGSMISQAKTKHDGLMRLVRLLHSDLFPNG